MRAVAAFLALALLIAACGSGSGAAAPATTAPQDAPETTVAAAPTPSSTAATVTAPSLAAGPIDEVDLVTFVAAMEDALRDTVYAGQALDAPDVFLATGTLFCEQLDAGMTPDEVLTRYIETLTGGFVDEAPADDLTMAGGVLGVGVVTLCPQHLDTVSAST